MIFNVEIYESNKANKFLRKLWAEFRKEFGKCSWQYAPYKIGKDNIIVFGMMDIGIQGETLEVKIGYIQKGTIKTISFNLINQKISKETYEELRHKFSIIIETAKINFVQPSKFIFQTEVSNLLQALGYYRGEAFCTSRSQKNKFNFTMATVGYDDVDANTEYKKKILHCLNLLSVETNSSFWTDNLVKKINQEVDVNQEVDEEIFVQDLEWIDKYPVIAEKLRLSKAGKIFLDLIAKDQLNESQELFLKACNHFQTARKYDAQVLDLSKHSSMEEVESGVYQITFEERDERLSMASKMGASHIEIATVFYISALEIASSISISIEEPKNCSECGQKVYSISRRVTDMVKKYLNDDLAKEFKSYYGKRSKYLHTGELLYNYSYIGTSIPQLDPSDPTGCHVNFGIPLLNLREYTSFCLRKVLQSLVADKDVENVTTGKET